MRFDCDGEQWWVCWICRAFADRPRDGSTAQPVLAKHEVLLADRFAQMDLRGPVSRLLYRPFDEEASLVELGHGQRGLICAAAIMQESNVLTAPLDVLTDEEHVVCDLCDGMRGSTFMKVVSIVPLLRPEPAIAAGQAFGHLREAFTLTPECIQRCLFGPAAHGQINDEVNDRLLFECFACFGSFPENLATGMNTALQVPSGLCELMTRGLWSTCGLLPQSRWSTDCSMYPLHELVKARAAQLAADGSGRTVTLACDNLPFNPHMYTALSKDMREWSAAIIQAHDPDFTGEVQSRLQEYILWLDSTHESMAPKAFASHAWETSKKKAGGALHKGLGRRGQYATSFLLQTVMFAMHLRNSAALSVALRKAFALLPPLWSNVLQESLSMVAVPSAATISRAKLFLDVTYMLYMRTRLQDLLGEGSCFYLLCDSSPQGNQNWEMMEWYGIKGSCMAQAFDMFLDQMKLKATPLHELTREALQEAAGRADVIRDAQIHHVLPPVALGVRRATILHKIHAILHGIRLEASSFQQVQTLLDNALSVTADLGTESELVHVEVDAGRFYPFWAGSDGMSFQLSSDAGAAEDPATLDTGSSGAEYLGSMLPAASNSVSFQGCLYVPGLFHILDGATHELLNHSLLWPDIKPMYECAVRFFHHAHYRRFFLQCCLDEPQLQGLGFLFDDGPPIFEGGRAWGVLAEGVAWLLRRQTVLQRTWASGRMARPHAGAAAAEDANEQQSAGREDTSLLVQKTTLAVQSPLFWAFCKLINSLVEIISALTAWSQSCPCHSKPLRDHMVEVLGLSGFKCPMRGLRCPEIVAGDLRALLDKHLAYQSSEMGLQMTVGLSQDEQSKARLDWTRLKGQLKMQLELKLMPFSSLPLSILGLGHWDEQKARELMWRAAAEYEALTPEEQESAHPLTKHVFASGARVELVKFLQGQSAETLPSLMKIRRRSLWCPVLEQSIERKHAQLHARIKAAPNHSAPYVSITERAPELTDLMSREASAINSFSAICADIRQPVLVAQALGLLAHPVFRQAQTLRPKEALSHRLVAACVYRADPQTQFAPLDASAVSGLKPPPNPSPFGKDASDDKGVGQGDFIATPAAGESEQSVANTWKVIMNNMTFKHFAATASATDFFSVPAETARQHVRGQSGLGFQPLADVVRPSAASVPKQMLQEVLGMGVSSVGALALPSQSESCAVALSFEQDSGLLHEGHGSGAAGSELQSMLEDSDRQGPGLSAESQDPRARHVFFRLLSSTLAAKKRSRTDRKIDLNRNQFCVQQHVVHKVDLSAKEVHVALSSLGLGEHDAGATVQVWDRPESIRMFLKWGVQRHYHFLRGEALEADAQEAFDLLLKNHGVSALLTVGLGEQSESLQRGLSCLASLDIAECSSPGPNVAVWGFTESGRSKILENVVLASPIMASSARQSIPFEEQTAIELLGYLKNCGWTFCVEANKAVEPPPCKILNGRPGPKIIYARPLQQTVLHQYLLCLAKMTSAKPDDAPPIIGSEVRHFQVKAYYLELLGKEVKVKGSRNKKQSLRILQDAGLDTAALAAAEHAPSRKKRQRLLPALPAAAALPGPAPAQSDFNMEKEDSVAAVMDVVPPPPVVPDNLRSDKLAEHSSARARGPESHSGAPEPSGRLRSKHDKTFRWGPGLITFKPPKTYQATCFRTQSHKHELGHNTRCTRTRTFQSVQGEQKVLRELKHWLNVACQHDTRLQHMGAVLRDIPEGADADATLAANCVDEAYETEAESERESTARPAKVFRPAQSFKATASSSSQAKSQVADGPQPVPKKRLRLKTSLKQQTACPASIASNANASGSVSSSSSSSGSSSSSDSSSSSSCESEAS